MFVKTPALVHTEADDSIICGLWSHADLKKIESEQWIWRAVAYGMEGTGGQMKKYRCKVGFCPEKLKHPVYMKIILKCEKNDFFAVVVFKKLIDTLM